MNLVVYYVESFFTECRERVVNLKMLFLEWLQIPEEMPLQERCVSNKLLGQGYVKERLKSSLRKFYGRYGDLTKQYEVPLPNVTQYSG